MIIKSMSRKTRSFGQLIRYMGDIEKSEHRYNVYQNLYSRKPEDIEAEFQDNADHVKRRRNGVYLYHEILSISKAEQLDRQKQKEILMNIAYEYARRRAQNNLIFGTLHDDHYDSDGHLHYHLLISSNAVGDTRKTRLSKSQFDKLKKGMELQVLTNHPELEQQVVINKRAGEKLSHKGYEQKRRTGKTPQRDLLKQRLRGIFHRSSSKQAFFSSLLEEGLELYLRGKSFGIHDHATDRKHRLKTLGFLDEFTELSTRIGLDQAAHQQPKQKVKNHTHEKKTTETEKQASTDSSSEDTQARRSEEIKNIREKQSQGKSSSDSKGRHKQ